MEGEDTLPQQVQPGTDPPSAPLEERIAQEAARAKLFGAAAQPQRLDRYIVIDTLGSGAMGTVYAAYDPKLDRRVALKLVRHQSEQQDARLIREAQALAQVSHPNIVQVYDVGSMRFGVQSHVFIAMELIEGTTLRSWLEDKDRSLDEIVGVFTQVGEGLAAAHRGGLVHRDFKPDNVLVGDDGRPRVLDFGLVRRGERETTVDTPMPEADVGPSSVDRLTRTGTIMGTPAYMSPEQHQGSAVDARSDQFAFCVALHEGLHGVRPFAGDTLPELATNVIEGRRAKIESKRTLPGRLRAALERGLATDPADRFESMDMLLVELKHRPRWRAGAVVLGLAAAGTLAWATLGRADAQPCSADGEPLGEVWNEARSEELRAAFGASDLGFAQRTAAQAVDNLDAYAVAWDASRLDACRQTRIDGTQSEHMFDLRMSCLERRKGEVAALLDVFADPDEAVITRAVELAGSLPPPSKCDDTERLLAAVPPPDAAIAGAVAEQQQRLAEARTLQRAGKFGEAMALFEDIAAEARSLAYAPLLADALGHLANAKEVAQDLPAAEALGVEAFQVALAAGAAEPMALAASNLVSTIGAKQRRYKEAEVWIGHARAAVERTGGDAVQTARLQHREGTIAFMQERHEDAAKLLRAACEGAEEALGPEAPDVIKCRRGLASALNHVGQSEEAMAMARASLADAVALLGPDHPDVGNVYMMMGVIAATQGDPGASLEHSREALRVYEAAYGPTHPRVADILTNIGNRHREGGEHELALESYARSLRIVEKAHGKDSPLVASEVNNVALAKQNLRQFEEALALYERGAALAAQGEGRDRRGVGISHNNIGNILMELDRPKDAIEHYDKSLAVLEEALGKDHVFVASPLSGLGDAYVELERYEEATKVYERAIAIRDAKGDPEADRTRKALADALDDLGRRNEAAKVRARIAG